MLRRVDSKFQLFISNSLQDFMKHLEYVEDSDFEYTSCLNMLPGEIFFVVETFMVHDHIFVTSNGGKLIVFFVIAKRGAGWTFQSERSFCEFHHAL